VPPATRSSSSSGCFRPGAICSGPIPVRIGAEVPEAWEAGAYYYFAPSASTGFKVREYRTANIEQFLLYRAQRDHRF